MTLRLVQTLTVPTTRTCRHCGGSLRRGYFHQHSPRSLRGKEGK